MLHYDFVNYDDADYVRENLRIRSGWTLDAFRWAFSTGHAGNWHPLTWLSHMTDCQLFGLNPGAHHLVNVLLHAVTAALLFGLLKRMTWSLWRSAFVAALFALHPLHVESVAWVAERKDVLSALFGILTLWSYVRYIEQMTLHRHFLCLLFFSLGLMAKPMLVTLPFVLLLLDFWPLGRMDTAVSGGMSEARKKGSPTATLPRRNLQSLIREKIPFFLLAAASSIVTYVIQQRGGAVETIAHLAVSFRLANALLSYVTYLSMMLWPVNLAVFYPYPSVFIIWRVAAAAVFLLGISILAVRTRARYPYLPVGWFWYIGTLVPVIGIIQVGEQSMADRYTYLPSIGMFIIFAWSIPDLLGRSQARSIPLAVAAGVAILLCMITTWGQVRFWRNSITLFEHALAVTANNYTAHNALGLTLAQQGNQREAITHYQDALRIKPNDATVHYNLGLALASQGKYKDAIEHYFEALALKPNHAQARTNLGVVLYDQGRVAEAIAQYTEALRLRPDLVEAHYNLGLARASQGAYKEAIRHYSEALRLRPDSPNTHNNLGAALYSDGRIEEAIVQYRDALRLKPDHAEARRNLEVALAAKAIADKRP